MKAETVKRLSLLAGGFGMGVTASALLSSVATSDASMITFSAIAFLLMVAAAHRAVKTDD